MVLVFYRVQESRSLSGLTHYAVCTLGSLMSYVEEGTKARKTASTHQNPSSSRSHALLTIALSQRTADVGRPGTSSSSRKREDASPRGGSRLHLVDLAGSESAATCGGVHRLKVSHYLKIISSAARYPSATGLTFAMKIDTRARMEPCRVINLFLATIAR